MRKLTAATTVLLASTALVFAAEINRADVPKMHETFAANPARFAHNYVGKTFTSSMVVSDITEKSEDRGKFIVALGAKSEVSCSDVPTDDALAFNKGDTVDVTGGIVDHEPGVIKLEHCAFLRSVPADETAPAPAKQSQLETAPAPVPTAMAEPKIIYLPSPPAPQVIYVHPQGASPGEPTEQEQSPGPQSSLQPTQPSPIHKGSYPAGAQLPPVMTMACTDGTSVRLVTDGSALQIVDGPRFYTINRSDNQANHILYIAGKRRDKVMYFAFDYSRFKDESAIRVKTPDGQDMRAKCSVDWQANG